MWTADHGGCATGSSASLGGRLRKNIKIAQCRDSEIVIEADYNERVSVPPYLAAYTDRIGLNAGLPPKYHVHRSRRRMPFVGHSVWLV